VCQDLQEKVQRPIEFLLKVITGGETQVDMQDGRFEVRFNVITVQD
jgi:hypothetical protein